MTRVTALIAGCLGALAFVAGAQAADPGRSWPLPEVRYEKPEQPQYKELLSGWYLRGDLGYRFNKVGGFEGSSPVTSHDYRNAMAVTFGFGYKYQWFRADVTLDRGLRTNYGGTTSTGGVLQPQYSAKIDALSLLANAYIDFGTWGGFTPYVGGGIGGTRLKSTRFHDTGDPAGALAPGEVKNFSWALMGGVAFQVLPNWMIDVGFRHLDMGDVPSTLNTGLVPPANFKKLTADEVRIGIRFLFD